MERSRLFASYYTAVVCAMALLLGGGAVAQTLPYAIVDTNQTTCYNDSTAISAPSAGQAFYGQDSQHTGNGPQYTLSGDGLTVYDEVTGLTWQKSPDTERDGDIDVDDKLLRTQFASYVASLNAETFGGFNDWRMPTIKELYSLILFSGEDPSGYMGTDTSGLVPFIDTDYFDFGYGDTDAGERIIDAQFASDTVYVSTVMNGMATLFGVNFADGRIKGYPYDMKTFYVICVRGNTDYGTNDFTDNGDGTITDDATGLTWTQTDSGSSMNWQEALAWVQAKNGENYLGQNDWRLPNAKELESIIDYTRSPATTASAAIDPLFSCTAITNEAGQTDYPYYWSSTTHANFSATPGSTAAYVSFGRAMGYWTNVWQDVHGAGAQRSDPKDGDPGDYPTGHGPQGDAIRIFNYVRLVRDADVTLDEPDPVPDTDGDGLSDEVEDPNGNGIWEPELGETNWEDPDSDGDGVSDGIEVFAGTDPLSAGDVPQVPSASGMALMLLGLGLLALGFWQTARD